VSAAPAPRDALPFARVDGVRPETVVDGTLVGTTLANGARLCVGRHNGMLFAVKDSCPHSEYPLSEGTL
jgi:nitrite reductase/ring-hydroxylating ferredoxin subunit